MTEHAIEVLKLEAQALLDCATRLGSNQAHGSPDTPEAQEWGKAVALFSASLDKGGRIVVIGLGKSGKIAQKISATFSSTGSPSIYLHPTEALHGDLGTVSKNDSALLLSYTGNTDEMIKLIPSLKSLGVPLVGLGGFKDSQLAQKMDAWIDGSVSKEACPHNLAPTSSTTLALALGDAVAVTLMKTRGFEANDFAKNHPGGALGRRLNLRVSDLMQAISKVPVLLQDASMDEVIVQSTSHKLGAVLIANGNGRLEGIITDGDLRRALHHREKFFSMKAGQVMTKNPISIGPEVLAFDALSQMENRPSQISVLPVVGPQGQVLGLLRLHDLVQAL